MAFRFLVAASGTTIWRVQQKQQTVNEKEGERRFCIVNNAIADMQGKESMVHPGCLHLQANN